MKRAQSMTTRAGTQMKSSAGALMAGLALVWMMWAPRPVWGQWTGGPTGPIYYNGGNVGIGTTAPYDQLHVAAGLRIGNWQGNGNGFSFAQDSTGNLEIQYKISTAVYANIMTLGFAGNVGIGTTNPQYRLSVNGQIGAKDVIVTNTGWSDYVFRPGYQLRPLSEVSAYIQANHHLPDVPSEAEVQEKGVSIGDMQSKLLAKIEELTLHMIQQDKENRDLRERMAQLEAHAAGVPSGPGAPATSR